MYTDQERAHLFAQGVELESLTISSSQSISRQASTVRTEEDRKCLVAISDEPLGSTRQDEFTSLRTQKEPSGGATFFRSCNTSFRAIAAFYQKGWTAEICSCILAALSLLALVVTLLVHQNRPLPNWPRLITINALVSIFTSLFRSAIAMVLAEGR